jgi:hypothetical protein
MIKEREEREKREREKVRLLYMCVICSSRYIPNQSPLFIYTKTLMHTKKEEKVGR